MARTEGYQTDDNYVFSLDISNHNGKAFCGRNNESVPEGLANEQVSRLVALISHHTSFEDKLLNAVRRLKAAKSAADTVALAQLLQEDGYCVRVHGPGTENTHRKRCNNCLETLHHNYLTCNGDSRTHLQEELIVEPRFKEEFEIAHPTAEYNAFLCVLPAEYVGTPQKLSIIVETVSQAAAKAFQGQGMAVPPWRRTTATLSKWALEPSQSEGVVSQQPTEQRSGASTNSTNVGFQIPGGNLTVRVPPRSRRSQDCPATPAKAKPPQRVSLLARGIADMAALQRAQCKGPPEAAANNDKLKRTFSWDFSGLQPITTVRRAGKAH